MEALAARADSLVVHHDVVVAAVATVEDPVVAPVTAGGRPAQQQKQAGGAGRKNGVCYSHYKFGDDAWQCDQPGNCAFKSEN